MGDDHELGARFLRSAERGARASTRDALRASRTTFGSGLGGAGDFARDAAKGAIRGVREEFGVGVQAPERAAVVAEGATSTSQPSLLQRHLGRSGGRWGSAATRSDNASIASYFEEVEGYGARTQGACGAKEEWFRGPGGGTRGGTFVDVTVRDGSGRTIRIQTVSTLADEITPTASELSAADRIMAKYPGDSLLLVSKTK